MPAPPTRRGTSSGRPPSCPTPSCARWRRRSRPAPRPTDHRFRRTCADLCARRSPTTPADLRSVRQDAPGRRPAVDLLAAGSGGAAADTNTDPAFHDALRVLPLSGHPVRAPRPAPVHPSLAAAPAGHIVRSEAPALAPGNEPRGPVYSPRRTRTRGPAVLSGAGEHLRGQV